MKTAMEFRAGNVIMLGKDPMVVLRTEYSRGGRNSATVRMKLKTFSYIFTVSASFAHVPISRWSRAASFISVPKTSPTQRSK